MKENKVVEIKDKLVKAEEKLATLLEQKKKIDVKIANVKSEIDNYNTIINQQKFNELNEVLTVKGVNIDELMQAIKSNNLNAIRLATNTDNTNNNANY